MFGFANFAEFMGRPLCAICKRAVDSIEWSENRASDERIITAKCHGASQTIVLTTSDFRDAKVIEWAPAFDSEDYRAMLKAKKKVVKRVRR